MRLLLTTMLTLATVTFMVWQESGSEAGPTQPLAGEVIGKDGAPMMLVPAGKFTMGDGSYNNLERRIYLDAFYIDKFELTVSRYAKYLDATTSRKLRWTKGELLAHGDRPVVEVDWQDADSYCRWSSKRLPNEAEWEKAARGTDGRIYPWGNQEPNPSFANFDWDGKHRWEGYRTLSVVGSYEAGKSPFGLYDMAGNVWEWVENWHDKNEPEQKLKKGSEGERKVVRGGSWANDASNLSAANWFGTFHALKANSVGFRCAQDAPK